MTLSKSVDGVITQLAGPVSFKVKPLKNTVLPASDRKALAAFQDEVNEFARVLSIAQRSMGEVNQEMRYIKEAITKSPVEQADLSKLARQIQQKMSEIQIGMNGDRVAGQLDIDKPASVAGRLGMIRYEMYNSTSSPTKTHQQSLKIAKENFAPLRTALRQLIQNDLKQLQNKLEGSRCSIYA